MSRRRMLPDTVDVIQRSEWDEVSSSISISVTVELDDFNCPYHVEILRWSTELDANIAAQIISALDRAGLAHRYDPEVDIFNFVVQATGRPHGSSATVQLQVHLCDETVCGLTLVSTRAQL